MNSKGTILVVDDESGSLLMLTNTLIAEGYDVRPADSGELAIASVAAATPELILLDICMPGMDGFEVCRQLKAAPETKDIPLMFLSGLTDTKECVEGLKLGAVDFVSKPFQKEELLARIETHLELSRLRNRLEHMVAERTANLKAVNEQLRTELAERRRAEQALRESEVRFRSVANSAPVVIWTAGPTRSSAPYAELDFINAYGLKLVGRTMEEVTESGWLSVIHPDDLQHVYPELDPARAANGELRAEYRVRRADGEYRWMLDTATPRFLPNGAFAGHVGIAVDITELKQHQERIMAAQKLESLGVLISGVAHNFNNLMGAIIAEADLALSELPAGAATHGNVERISAVAIRAANIVSLLTAYASGGARTLGPVNVTQVVEQTLQLTRATCFKERHVCRRPRPETARYQRRSATDTPGCDESSLQRMRIAPGPARNGVRSCVVRADRSGRSDQGVRQPASGKVCPLVCHGYRLWHPF